MLLAMELQKAVEAGTPRNGYFDSYIIFDSLTPCEADDKLRHGNINSLSKEHYKNNYIPEGDARAPFSFQ